MKLVYKISLLGILVLLFSCNKPKVQPDTKTEQKKGTSLVEKQRKRILGKRLTSLNSILGDSIKLSNKIVLLYNGFDCHSCIDEGYKIVLNIENKKKGRDAFIIATSANISQDQISNSYEDYVFNDEHDLIRKELKYIKTPVLLRFDDKSRICQVFFPLLDSDRLKESFIRKSLP